MQPSLWDFVMVSLENSYICALHHTKARYIEVNKMQT